MKPAITITEKSIRVSTDAFDMNIEFAVNDVKTDYFDKMYRRMNEVLDEDVQQHYSIKKETKDDFGDQVAIRLAKTYKPRTCQFCKHEYVPTGPTQRFCTDTCKELSKRKRPLSEMEEAELEKTLQEIEQRRKHYQI